MRGSATAEPISKPTGRVVRPLTTGVSTGTSSVVDAPLGSCERSHARPVPDGAQIQPSSVAGGEACRPVPTVSSRRSLRAVFGPSLTTLTRTLVRVPPTTASAGPAIVARRSALGGGGATRKTSIVLVSVLLAPLASVTVAVMTWVPSVSRSARRSSTCPLPSEPSRSEDHVVAPSGRTSSRSAVAASKRIVCTPEGGTSSSPGLTISTVGAAFATVISPMSATVPLTPSEDATAKRPPAVSWSALGSSSSWLDPRSKASADHVAPLSREKKTA